MRRLVLLAISFGLLVPAAAANAQWQALGLSGREVHRLHIDGGLLYACTSDGLYRIPLASPDTAWTLVGFEGSGVLDIAFLGPDTLLAAKALGGAPGDTISLFRRTGPTAAWTPFQNGFGAGGNREARRLLPLSGVPRTVLALGGGRIEKSSDQGLSWRVVSQGNAVNALEQAPSDPMLVWSGGETAIFAPYVLKSTDAGETWVRLDFFAGGDNAVDAIACHPVDPDVVFLGMEGRVMMSKDGGGMWWNMTSPEPSIYTYGLAIRPFLPLTIYAAGSSFVPDPRGVVFHRSYDGGLSWSHFSYPAYAWHGVNQLLLSTEGAAETLHLATWSGVYRFAENPVGVPVAEEARGVGLRCRPNPFRRTLELEVTLPAPRRASLVILDVSGRTVATMDAGIVGPGPRRVSWDARGLAAGVYVCRLTAGRDVRSLKILHLP